MSVAIQSTKSTSRRFFPGSRSRKLDPAPLPCPPIQRKKSFQHTDPEHQRDFLAVRGSMDEVAQARLDTTRHPDVSPQRYFSTICGVYHRLNAGYSHVPGVKEMLAYLGSEIFLNWPEQLQVNIEIPVQLLSPTELREYHQALQPYKGNTHVIMYIASIERELQELGEPS